MRGKREAQKEKLNLKKVFMVLIIFVLVIIAIVMITKKLGNKKENNEPTITESKYFLYFDNNKWGVIDNQGNIIIEPAYEEMIIIPDDTKDVFICYLNVNYEDNIHESKVLNSKGEAILTGYSYVEPIADLSEKTGFKPARLTYMENDKYGLIDLEGNKITEPMYNSISYLADDKNELLVVIDSKYGVIDLDGKQIVAVTHDNIQSTGKTNAYNTETNVLRNKKYDENLKQQIGEFKLNDKTTFIYYTK